LPSGMFVWTAKDSLQQLFMHHPTFDRKFRKSNNISLF